MDLVSKSGVDKSSRWIEPFFGTGVVGFNSITKGTHIGGDTNPHIINFYKSVQEGNINEYTMREYLEKEGNALSHSDDLGYCHYVEVRNRFNKNFDPYDFIFLSRSGFNGMMRFNSKGLWNIPFCKKPDRFSPAYITKICNQVKKVRMAIKSSEWIFLNEDFEETISMAEKEDIIYCDPPYYGRYADYYNSWTGKDEQRLYEAIKKTKAKFVLSTWHHNNYRENESIGKYWSEFNIITTEHFYHNGGYVDNRHPMTEALIFNFDIQSPKFLLKEKERDLFYNESYVMI